MKNAIVAVATKAQMIDDLALNIELLRTLPIVVKGICACG